MAEIIDFHQYVTGEMPAPEMLRNIADGEPINAFVIVWPADGSMPTYHSSTSDIPVIMMRCQEFIHKYFNGDFSA